MAALNDAGGFQALQPVRENGWRDALDRIAQFRKPAAPAQQISDHEQRPPVTHEVKCVRDGTLDFPGHGLPTRGSLRYATHAKHRVQLLN